jgi:UDP-N-acetylglucosamine 1-carboxyvinyltransferase
MIEIGSWIGLAAMTRVRLPSKMSVGIIWVLFQVLLEKSDYIRAEVMIFISAHEDGYEIKTDIDGSILTIADAPWPGFTPDLLSIVLVVATQAKEMF